LQVEAVVVLETVQAAAVQADYFMALEQSQERIIQ
jgi:hypothetical protein